MCPIDGVSAINVGLKLTVRHGNRIDILKKKARSKLRISSLHHDLVSNFMERYEL